MAEDKKTFLQGKMNQDIDDRILPNGEYRSAQNIQVTTSEGSDVGSIQNILGNTRIINSVLDQYSDLENIGCFFDEKNNKIFYFVTNYTCPNPEDTGLVGGVLGPETAEQFALRTGDNLFCGIFMTTKADGDLFPQPVLLAQGLFFNFSKTHLITGVNLLEELLFFTDGLNQPRKINVSIAADNPPNISQNIPGHYNKEDKVSVAKFAPFMPPLLLDYNTTTLNGNAQATTTDDFGNVTNVHPTSSMELSSQNNFPEDFLREKFVRFSYRYKFIDGEYSTIAPFTQICFIPKTTSYNITQLQKVFKKGEVYFQDTSGIADGMVNDVTAVNLNIILPSRKIKTDLDITAIEILYKESDNNLIRAVELKDIDDTDSANGVYQFKYKSTLPYKTLPQDQLTRVYDNIPLSAKAQEIISNRVVYGNYVEQRKLPTQAGQKAPGINFSVGTSAKFDTEASFGNADFNNYYLHKEYPFHSVKQRRTYEIGVVLSDKFGRQSPVITSASGVSSINIAAKDQNFNSSSWDVGNSTDANSAGGTVIADQSPGDENYCGDALTLTFNEEIPNAYAKSTFIPINESGISTVTYANNLFKTIFATDPLLQGGGTSGTGVILGELFYYSTTSYGRVQDGVSDFLYLDATLQTVLTGYNEVFLRYSVNTSSNPATLTLIHKVSLNFTTGAIEGITTTEESIFQSNLIGLSAPVSVGSANDIVNITPAVTVVTPNQTAITSGDFSDMFRLFIENFTQTDLFQVGDYLKGQDTDFVKILAIESAGGNLSLYTEGPASLLYQNYTGDPASPVFTNVDTYGFFKYNLTPHGWYSYRVVVKQTEQEYYNVYAPGAISFDNDQDENKTYIPITSDSINKITRDIEFTNTQEQGLSTSKNRVYPKVIPAKENTSEGHSATDANALSKQSDSDLIDVISIGTAKEQGLKNDNENVFDFVYESNKNTLMAQLPYGDDNNFIGASVDSGFVGTTRTIITTDTTADSQLTFGNIKLKNRGKNLVFEDTSFASRTPVYATAFPVGDYLKGENKDLVKIIKVTIASNIVTVECDGAIKKLGDAEDGKDIPVSMDIKVFSYKYGSQDRISVFETKPFESVLDIYYETSTAGLVHELNEAVSFPSTVKSLNLIDINFDESVNYFDSNGSWNNEEVATIQLLDQFENELTAGTSPSQINPEVDSDNISTFCKIISQQGRMISNSGTPIQPLEVDRFVIILDPNDNKFKIKPKLNTGNFVYFPNNYPIGYDFLIEVTNNDGEVEILQASISLGNVAPDTSATPSSFTTIGAEPGAVIFEFTAKNGSSAGSSYNQLGLFYQDAGIGDDFTNLITMGFDVNGNSTTDQLAIVPQGSGITVQRQQVLFDTDGNVRPEVLIDNATGDISLTELHSGNFAANLRIEVIDSNDFGLISSDPNGAQVGGLSFVHELFLVVNDGLIVIEPDTLLESATSTFTDVNNVVVDVFDRSGSDILLTGDSNYSTGIFNNYWSNFLTAEQIQGGMSEIPEENIGIFLWSKVGMHQGGSTQDATYNRLKAAYALRVDNEVPKIIKYTASQQDITYPGLGEPDGANSARVYQNHWLASSTTDLDLQYPGGYIYATDVHRSHQLVSYSGNDMTKVGLSSDIDGQPDAVSNPQRYLPTIISEIDPSQELWNRNDPSGFYPYGNTPDQQGYFRVYGNGEDESAGIAIPSERQGEYNEPKTFLYKAHDTVPLGGIIYNILYEIRVVQTNPPFVANTLEMGKVFLCRASDFS
tara:strand:+ start:1320 stop:6539 length:5220 start_codon:yes stop_codon:yes gene_type:complete